MPYERCELGSDPWAFRRSSAAATECATLDQLLAGARQGRSSVLVVRGEAGISTSAVLEHAADHADGGRVLPPGWKPGVRAGSCSPGVRSVVAPRPAANRRARPAARGAG